MATPQETKNKLQQLIDALNQAIAVEFGQSAIAGALAGGISLPPIRRDEQGVDHPEEAGWPEELHEWAEAGIVICDEFPEQGGG